MTQTGLERFAYVDDTAQSQALVSSETNCMNLPDNNWNTPPERLELNDDGIDVWRARSDSNARPPGS